MTLMTLVAQWVERVHVSGVRWDQAGSDGTRWVRWGVRWDQVGSDGTKWVRWGVRWDQVGSNGTKWGQMEPSADITRTIASQCEQLPFSDTGTHLPSPT